MPQAFEQDEEVELAVKGLRKAVNLILKRYERRRVKQPQLSEISSTKRKRIEQIIKHMRHCLTELVIKHQSLKIGFECLAKELWPTLIEQISCSSALTLAEWTHSLQHFFQQLLRLHDGLILLVSGECRHSGDTRQASQTRFPSLLTKGAERADGYTRLYSNQCTYSGTGWDEFMDKRIGLQYQLKRELETLVTLSKRDTLWDDLIESGAQGLEAVLTSIEVQMKDIQQGFSTFVKQATIQLKAAFQKHAPAVSVHLSLADKMERLGVSVGSDIYQLERRAKEFQISDKAGVLPKHYGKKEWSHIMELPPIQQTANKKQASHNIKKRRRIIQESDDEDDDQNLPNQADGLVVRVQSKKQTNNEVANATSVREIKQQLGVDVEGLAAAREGLEAEEAGATQAAAVIDNAPVDYIGSDENEVAEAEGKVKRMRRILNKVVNREAQDEYEIWDARECLREALMVAGNRVLWASTVDTIERRDGLDRAIEYFSEAMATVEAQEKLHARMALQKNEWSEESSFFRRNLLLLRGQAHTNTGIANIEVGRQLRQGDGDRKASLREAIQELEKAVKCSEALIVQAEKDRKDGASPVETRLDSLRAKHLKSLTLRWIGTAYWHQGRLNESARTFELAASLTDERQQWKDLNDEDLLFTELELRTECYYAWTALADLASKALERAPVKKDEVDKSDALVSTVSKALESAARISRGIQELISSAPNAGEYNDFQRQNDVTSPGDLLCSLNEIKEWWKRRKASLSELITVPTAGASDLPRNDLRGDCSQKESLPPRIFVVSEGNRRRKMKRIAAGGTGYSNIGPSTSDVGASAFEDQTSNPSRKPRTYRKWGDELFPQVVDSSGRKVPKLSYPAVAPEMPPEIEAKLKAFRNS